MITRVLGRGATLAVTEMQPAVAVAMALNDPEPP